MKTISLRLNDEHENKAQKLAKKNNQPLAKYLRQLVEEALAVAEYKEQHIQEQMQQSISPKDSSPATQSHEDQLASKLSAEYEKNLEFATIETAFLLRLIVKESGKFTSEEITRLLHASQEKTEKYMAYYEKT